MRYGASSYHFYVTSNSLHHFYSENIVILFTNDFIICTQWEKDSITKQIIIQQLGNGPANLSNYRGVSLLDTAYRVYTRILNERLKVIADFLL